MPNSKTYSGASSCAKTKQRITVAVAAVLLLLSLALCSFSVLRGESGKLVYAAEEFSVCGKAAYLCDFATGTEVYAKNEHDRLPIASMVKIMTALMTFNAVEDGRLSLDEDVTVSAEAAGMGGSQVFLDAGSVHKASELLKSVVVASANDSCVALAEKISGSVGGFVNDMNAKAEALGMKNTHFANCTGLPAADGFSCAKDVSVMLKELLRYPKYYEYAGVWLEDFAHPGGRTTTITNTNKLIRFYTGCDGGKTGFTGEAKFCLAGTALRNGTRVIAVVIGADSSKERFGAVSGMFDYAFANYESKILASASECLESEVKVSGGKSKTVKVRTAENISVFAKRGESGGYSVEYDLKGSVKAPVCEGDDLGAAYLTKDGAVVFECRVVAAENVERANIFDIIRRIGGKW